jgi:phosphoserine phosphatase RsbU/P
LRDLQIGKTGQAFIMERNGNLIATSTTELPFRSVNGKRQRLSAGDSSDRPTRESINYLKTRFNNLREIQELQRQRIQIVNIPYVLTVLPYRDRQGLDWLIAVIIPESDFMDQIYANTRMNFWLCGLILLIAIAIGVLISRLITQPILRLNRAPQAIASGDFERRLKVQGIAELETLSESFNSMAEQLESAFENLEQRVSDRTSELAVANAQIVKLNANLSEENMRLSSELEITSRLQQMILPKERELKLISQLEISGFMEPALEVGGDYYDVLSSNEFIKIGFGDVTGHGLESGVLMIMLQTAIRTLQEHGESDPIKFLSTINRVIYKNAERMDSLKNLTLVILDYRDRILRLSGQHEEVIVMRAEGKI